MIGETLGLQTSEFGFISAIFADKTMFSLIIHSLPEAAVNNRILPVVQ